MSYYTNITNARKDLYKLAEMALENGTEININTKRECDDDCRRGVPWTP
jgi:hypothetical protein